jgi:hypothetical protein
VLWESLEHDAIYALTHPNGWGGSQQAQMREAAILAGVIPNTDQGLSRITFVTEGEASLLFCLSSGLKIAGDKVRGIANFFKDQPLFVDYRRILVLQSLMREVELSTRPRTANSTMIRLRRLPSLDVSSLYFSYICHDDC